MLTAAEVAPSFHMRQRIVAADLPRLDEPCVIFEHHGHDSDGKPFFIYTVGGYLDGHPLPEGCTVGGDVIVINADTREEADAMAAMGLLDSIVAMEGEDDRIADAAAALGRLDSVGALGRMEAATKPAADVSDAFVRDAAAIRPLIGDDIVLSSGARPDET